MKKQPEYVYVALAEDGNVLGCNTNRRELMDDTSGAWVLILKYSSPKVCDQKRRRTLAGSQG